MISRQERDAAVLADMFIRFVALATVYDSVTMALTYEYLHQQLASAEAEEKPVFEAALAYLNKAIEDAAKDGL